MALLSRLAPGVARDSLSLAPGYVVPGIANLVSVPLLFAVLGAEQYGAYVLMVAVSGAAPQVTTTWLGSINVRYGHRPGHVVGRRDYIVALVSSVIAGGALAWVLVPGPHAVVAATTALMTACVAAYLLGVSRLQSQMRFGRISQAASARAVVSLGASLAASLLLPSGPAAGLGLAAGFLVGASVSAWSGRFSTDHKKPAPAPVVGLAEARREVLRYGLASVGVAVGSYVLSVSDRFVLSAMRSLAEVGVYAATYSIVDLTFRFVPALSLAAVRPRLFRAWDRGDAAPAMSIVARASVVIAWLMAAGVIAVTAIGPEIRPLPIDPNLVGPIAVGLWASVVGSSLSLVYSAQQRQGRLAVSFLVSAGVNLAINLALVGALGAMAAALSTATAYLLFLASQIGGLRSWLGVLDWALWASAGLSLVAALLAGFARLTELPAAGLGLSAVLWVFSGVPIVRVALGTVRARRVQA